MSQIHNSIAGALRAVEMAEWNRRRELRQTLENTFRRGVEDALRREEQREIEEAEEPERWSGLE